MQVDIGIPHELWDKPSAEVKKNKQTFPEIQNE